MFHPNEVPTIKPRPVENTHGVTHRPLLNSDRF